MDGKYVYFNEKGLKAFADFYCEQVGRIPERVHIEAYFPDGWHFSDTLPTEDFTIDLSRHITKSHQPEPFTVTPDMCEWVGVGYEPFRTAEAA